MHTLLPQAIATLMLLTQASDSLTLNEALARARVARPQIIVAMATTERARGARRLATIIPNPSSQLEADDLAPTRKLTVTQSLAWLPRRGADVAHGRALVERAAADSEQIVADLGHDVRRAFFGALAAEAQLRIVTEEVALTDSLVRLAERRVSAGDISALERDQVAQEASRARLAASQVRETARTAIVDLARAVAWHSPGAPQPRGILDDGLDAWAASPPPAGSLDELDHIPAVRAAVADSAAAATRLHAARIGQIPVPGLLAGREWGGGSLVRRNVILGLALPIPLWSHGGEAVAEARSAATESAARLAETRLTLAAQLAAARIRVDEAAGRARFARDSLLAEAHRIRAGSVRLYEAGRTGILPVFDALRVEREVARTMVQELVAFQNAQAELTALMGRWQ